MIYPNCIICTNKVKQQYYCFNNYCDAVYCSSLCRDVIWSESFKISSCIFCKSLEFNQQEIIEYFNKNFQLSLINLDNFIILVEKEKLIRLLK